jgi:cation diffusion facilitator family transporter
MSEVAAGRRPRREVTERLAVRAGLVSVVAGALIMLAKFIGWAVTGSSAVFADAAESIVNVMAAAVATWSVAVSSRPADADHPYGHGKAESASAAVEGGLIMVAATLIAVDAVGDLLLGPALRQIGVGIAISAATALANLGLGLWLVRVGRRAGSEAIEADGVHVMTDVVTTAGTLVALLAVKFTGIALIDPLAALAVAANIVWTGSRVIRRALATLLDEADFSLLGRIVAALEQQRRPEWVEIHQLRAQVSGPFTHLDLHLIVPRYFTIEQAHLIGDDLERRLLEAQPGGAESVVHLDPCTPRHCPACSMADCPVRAVPCSAPFEWSVESLTRRGII